MQSNKERSAEESYKKFLDIMLYDVPLKQLDELVVNDVAGYGTTLDEKILEIERLRKLVIDQREQGAGYEINFVVNPIHRRINTDNGLAVFIDEIEITMSINGNKNIIPLRFSSVLELINGSWKIVHLHSSVAVNTEGDTWHKEEHLRKIEELEKLVSEKTEDLVKKNKELEIEASLERVRAVAMSMNKSDDLLSICEVSFKEFQKLGFNNLRNAIIHIPNDEQKYFNDYDYSELTGGAITKIKYGSHPIVDEYLKKIRSAEDAYFEVVINEDQLAEWKDFRKKSGQQDDPRLDDATALYYYLFSIGIGDIGISTFRPIDDSQKKILKRFRNVFDLAYRRYNDIALAEAQARESQIELALERVRARTMAMQKSDELQEAAALLFMQVKSLGVPAFSCGFNIWEKGDKTFNAFMTGYENTIEPALNLPFNEDPNFKRFDESRRKGENFYVLEMRDEAMQKHYQYLKRTVPVFKEAFDKIQRAGLTLPETQIHHIANFSHGNLMFITLEPCPEAHDIFKRFGNVFEQTYTRFLDLQKAESQAREAQIEASLERLRAKAMSMQKSDELHEVLAVLCEQFDILGILPMSTHMTILDIENNKFTFRETGKFGNRSFGEHTFALDAMDTWKDMVESWRSREPFSINRLHFPKESLPQVWDVFHKSFASMPEDSRITPDDYPDGIYHTAGKNPFGYVGMNQVRPATAEEEQIVIKFASEFGRAYQRFLDLQKAEAQAREAQIEAELERVRSRTMAMHTPNELGEVVTVIVEKLKNLGVVLDANGVVLCTYFHESKDVLHWIVSPDFSFTGSYLLPYFDHAIFNDAWESKESGVDYFSKAYSKKEKDSFFEYAFEHSDYRHFPDDFKSWVFQNNQHILSFAWQKNSAILIPSHTGVVPSANEIEILKRFARVFEQAYTRFLDLQKAEAQAREAQIELSLERIRAQVTAMRESSELLDIVVTMRSEFVALGHEAHYFWHMRWLPDKYDKAMTSGDGTRIGMVMTLPRHIHGDVKLVADWEKSDESTLVFAMDVDTAVEYVEKMITLGDFQQVDPQAPTLDDIRHIGGLTFIMARTTHGEIGFSLPGTVPNPPAEAVATLARFAAVFDLAYRRFEDLREAEEKNKIIQAENDRKTKELEEARELQISLLPKELPNLTGLEIAAFMRTATEVGGDYYDFIVQKNDILNVALGDATGHGLQAGTMVTLMKGLFTSNSSQLEPKEFMLHCARVIKDIKLGRILMSFIYLRFENSRFIASSAGMPPIYYHHKKSNRTEEIIIQGMPLGAMRNASYKIVEKQLCSGDTILLLTDGLPEQMNSHKVPFDYSRVRKYFGEIAENTPDEIINSLVKKADEWMNGTVQSDDISFVVIKVK